QPRGFGFVEMPVDTEAQAAIDGLSETPLKEQKLTVSKARPRTERGGGGGSYGGGGRRRY
ncbi:MAG: RNA-binding protein, partial [Chloroflexi bacterium CG07_land_8_20_14_0_80_45_17]